MDSLLPLLHDHLALAGHQLLIVCVVVGIAYVVFGLAGFGTALVAAPVLAHFMPVAHIVPLLALLDCAAAAINVARDRKAADAGELKRIVPAMVAGSLAGAAILVWGRPQALLLALGIFAVCYGLYSLSGYKPQARFSAMAAWPFGLMGGVFSALFGSGGFLYAIYLAGRIDSHHRIRVTQSTLIGCSTLTRVLLFLLAGVYASPGIWMLATVMAIPMLIGTAIGRRLTMRFTRVQFVRVVSTVVLCSGLSLIWRYLGG
jgi:uncharacterized membrane protein YfcA